MVDVVWLFEREEEVALVASVDISAKSQRNGEVKCVDDDIHLLEVCLPDRSQLGKTP